MRRTPQITVLLAAVLWVCCAPALAQQPSAQGTDAAQQAPDAPQPAAGDASPSAKKKEKPAAHPSPEGKSAAEKPTEGKPGSAKAPAQKPGETKPDSSQPSSPEPASTADSNPFPEAVSRQAAKADAGSADASDSAPKPDSTAKPSEATQNPFPEAISRQAAQAASDANAQKSKPAAELPPGTSSSSSSDLSGPHLENLPSNTVDVTDPARAKKDTQVGDFYLAHGDAKGAYMRFKDAIAFDPTNMDAVFGLAQAAAQLNKLPEAERNYQLYLKVIPTGSKAKQAAKELAALAGKK